MDSSTGAGPRRSRLVRLVATAFVLIGLSGCCCCVVPVAEQTGRQYVATRQLPDRADIAAALAPRR